MGIEVFNACFDNKRGQRILHTSGLGAMGYGLPAAIGACIGGGRRPMVAIESDGSLQLNIQELATIKAQKLPIRLFVLNNGGYGSIRNTQRNYFAGRYVGTGPESALFLPESGRIADAYGIPSMAIRDAVELRDGVRSVLRSSGPIVCDVRLLQNEQLWPKVAAIPQADGSIISMPMEDMSPLLPREEFRANMIVPLDPASEAIVDENEQVRR
jgi:acetolactate synthase-1/2/3 large subunit